MSSNFGSQALAFWLALVFPTVNLSAQAPDKRGRPLTLSQTTWAARGGDLGLRAIRSATRQRQPPLTHAQNDSGGLPPSPGLGLIFLRDTGYRTASSGLRD